MLNNILNVLWLSPYDYKPDGFVNLHSHSFYQLIYVVRGDGIFVYGSEQYKMSAGCNFLIHPNQKHSLVNTGADILKTLDIKFHLFDQELIKQLECMNCHLCLTTSETEIYWNHIKASSKAKPAFYKEEVRLNMALLLLNLIRSSNSESQEVVRDHCLDYLNNDNDTLQAFMEFIQENYQKNLTLNIIADAIGYNKSYLCQLFRKSHHGTPMRFLYAYRIQMAIKLIQRDDYDLKQIAQMTGFNSIHHFSRTFGSIVGTSPGAYRDSEKGGICQDINVEESFQNRL